MNRSNQAVSPGKTVGQSTAKKRAQMDQRNEQLKGRLAARREILWWNICAEKAQNWGDLSSVSY
jgi:hypothetical protein